MGGWRGDHGPARPGGVWQAVGLLVLSLSGGRICAMTRFDAATLPGFGLPPVLGAT
jgi:RNA polymerase sigma-70 factor (ECF subfamily)